MDNLIINHKINLDKRVNNLLRLYKEREINDTQFTEGVYRIIGDFLLIMAKEVDELNKNKK